MFQTFDHAKIPVPFCNSDENVWAYAELMVNAQWFFVDCQIKEGDISVRSSYILSNSTQLNDLNSNQDVLIKGVYVVTPPHMNCTDFWKMDQVASISRGKMNDSNYETEFDIYELFNGAKYYSSHVVESEINIKNIRVVFAV